MKIDANDDPGGTKQLDLDGASINLQANTAVTGDLSLTGDLTVAGVIGSALETVADPGDGQTIVPPASGADFSCSITTGGAETRVLGTPTRIGQKAFIIFGTDGGNFTMDNASGWLDGGTADNLATFDDAGDVMVAMALATGAGTDWRSIADKGVAFS